MKKICLLFIVVFAQNLFAQKDLLVPLHDKISGKGIKSFWAENYSEQLISLKENNLQHYKCNCEIYRFLWLRSFNNPIAITIVKKNGQISLTWKRTNAKGNSETGILVENETISLNLESWIEFKNILDGSNFWKNPSILTGKNVVEVLDGASWVIEGVAKNDYHISEVNVTKIGRFLIENTEMDIPENEIY